MEALIKLVSEKTGISPEQATTAVNTVVGFLKDKLPAGVGQHLDQIVNSDASAQGGIANNLKDTLGNMFGK